MRGPDGAIKRIPLVLGGVTLLLGALDLALWALAPQLAATLDPAWFSILPHTALMLLLLGLAVMIRQEPARPAWWFRSLAGTVMALSALMLAEYAFGRQSGIGSVLFREAVMALGNAPPGRPALSALACLFLAAWSILLLDVRVGGRRTTPSEWLALIYCIIPYASVLGYSFGVTSMFFDAPGVRMALATALALCCIATGVLLDRANPVLSSHLSPDQPGGIFLRHFLPAVLILPPLLGWLRVLGVYAGLFDAPMGLTLMILATVLIGIWLLVWCADSLNRLDCARRRALAEADRREAELHRARELSALKDQFLSTMSHELKTPLSLLAGSAEILADKYPDEELLKGMQEGSDRLAETINHVLDYSALMSGSLPLYRTEVDLGEVVHHAQAIKESDLSRHGIALDVQVDAHAPAVFADPRRTLQVIVELLDHLARFGKQGVPAHVSVRPCDHGACVEIWEPGWDLSGAQEPVLDGLGGQPSMGLELALPIVRKLVELHGGRLVVQPASDLGSGVSVYLPEASAATRPPASPA